MFPTRRVVPQICSALKLSQTNYILSVTPSLNMAQIGSKSYISICSLLEFQFNKPLGSKYERCNVMFTRNYAKGKDKKKEKGKGKVIINENQIAEVINFEALKTQMEKAVVHMEEEFVKHLSLRSTTGAIESLPVHLDGKEHTMQELAQIVRKNPKTIVLNFATFPQAIPNALKALAKSGMNLNPQQDGTTLFIPIPKVTKEHREQLSKNAKQLFVKCKDSVRDVQIKFIKEVKKQNKTSEDLARNVEQQLIAIADKFIAQAEDILNKKQNELLGEK